MHAVFSPDSAKGASWTIRARIEAAGKTKACVCFGGEPGNPVWFSREYFPELMRLQGDRGGRRILRDHMEEAAWFQAAEARELADVDTMPQEGAGEGLSGGKTVCNQKEK